MTSSETHKNKKVIITVIRDDQVLYTDGVVTIWTRTVIVVKVWGVGRDG